MVSKNNFIKKRKKFSNFYAFFLFFFLVIRNRLILKITFYNKRCKNLKKFKKNSINKLRRTYYFLKTDFINNVILPPKLKSYFTLYSKFLLNSYCKIPPVNIYNIKKQAKIKSRKFLSLEKNQWNLFKINNFLILNINVFIANSFFYRRKLLLRFLLPFIKKTKFRKSKKHKFDKWIKHFLTSLIEKDKQNMSRKRQLNSFLKINSRLRAVSSRIPAESKIIPIYRSFSLNFKIRRILLKKHFKFKPIKRRRKSRRAKVIIFKRWKSNYKKYKFNKNNIARLKTPKAVKLSINKIINNKRIHYIIRNTMSSSYMDFYKLFSTLHGHLLKHGAQLKFPILTPLMFLNVLNNSSLFRNFLKTMLFLTFKRKKNNYYFTITNYFGEVLISRSCGVIVKRMLRKRNKKLRTANYYFYALIKSISNNLKRKRHFVIHYFLKNSNLTIYNVKKIIRMFRSNRIRVLKIKYVPNFSHGLPTKTKKIRRI